MQQISSAQLRSELAQFIGTETWHRHWTEHLIYTDGVEFFCEQAACYWFLDILATEVFPLQQKSPFLAIELDVADGQAEIRVTDGNDLELFKKNIQWTDAPEGVWRFYLTDAVCLLPSEY